MTAIERFMKIYFTFSCLSFANYRVLALISETLVQL